MKIIIGLGNIGKKYEETRHNAGFLALDYLQKLWQLPSWQEEKRFRGSFTCSQKSYSGEKMYLFKPHTMMNLSGEAVQALLHFYKLTPKDIIILHDDLDISAGTLRFTNSSRAAGHNGVQSIIDHLGTQDFDRIRIGIGRPTEVISVCQPSHDYVLDTFTATEKEKLTTLFPEIATLLEEKFL